MKREQIIIPAKELMQEVRRTPIRHAAFSSEAALIDHLAESCRGKRTAMLTGNYTVREGPLTPKGDRRLLGPDMLMTIDLCARVHAKCAEKGVETPAIVLLPNDIAPGTFSNFEEAWAFKAGYAIPENVRAILAASGLAREPLYFFPRRFDSQKEIQTELRILRARIADGSEKLIVTFESFAENLAAKSLTRAKTHLPGAALIPWHTKEKEIVVRAEKSDNLVNSRESQALMEYVRITHANGAPFCSFLAATLFREFEKLGFEQMINTFVPEEYPCVDKAAIAYRHLYEGKMRIRNIYLEMDGAAARVVHDNTIK